MYLAKGAIISGDAGEYNYIFHNDIMKLINEDESAKELWDLIQIKLKHLGFNTIDCTPYNKSFESIGHSLSYIVKKANDSYSDLHLSIHFNIGNRRGIECWVSESNPKCTKLATEICSNISNLDFYNRGVKFGDLYILDYTIMPCVIINCYFINNYEDRKVYDLECCAEMIVQAITRLGSS